MQRISRDKVMVYEFDWRHELVLRVRQGEKVVIETEDAGSGMVRSLDVTPQLDNLPTRKFYPPVGE